MQQKIPTIVFDADDTLLRYQEGFREYVNQYYGYEVTGLPSNYSLRDWIPAPEYMRKQMLERFNQSWQFGCLKPAPGAVDAIRKLMEYNQDAETPIELIVLSKCGNNNVTTPLRKANLTHVFGIVFNEVIIINGDESKKHYLKKLKRHRDILLSVDDFVGNILDMENINVPSVLIDQPHNRDVSIEHPHLKVSKNWDDIYGDYIKPLMV